MSKMTMTRKNNKLEAEVEKRENDEFVSMKEDFYFRYATIKQTLKNTISIAHCTYKNIKMRKNKKCGDNDNIFPPLVKKL